MAIDGGWNYETHGYQPGRDDMDEQENWWWEPEPVHLAPVPFDQAGPTRFDTQTASFQFPSDMVDARAQTIVEEAVRHGRRHTISLWREALRQSLEQAAREAAHTARSANCVALFWDRLEREYRVVVTFQIPQRGGMRARH